MGIKNHMLLHKDTTGSGLVATVSAPTLVVVWDQNYFLVETESAAGIGSKFRPRRVSFFPCWP